MGTITRQFTGVAAKEYSCWCGIQFAMPANLYAYYQSKNEEAHGSFSIYCPLGHGVIPAGKTQSQREADRLRDDLAKQKHLTEQAQSHAEWYRNNAHEANALAAKVTRSLRATRAVVTRTKKKIVAGRCPCCSHKFRDLAIHMATEHPKYDPDKAVAAIEAKGV